MIFLIKCGFLSFVRAQKEITEGEYFSLNKKVKYNPNFLSLALVKLVIREKGKDV